MRCYHCVGAAFRGARLRAVFLATEFGDSPVNTFVASRALLVAIARLWQRVSQASRAERLLWRALAHYEEVHGEASARHGNYAVLMIELAELLVRGARHHSAEVLLNEALDILWHRMGSARRAARAWDAMRLIFMRTGRARMAILASRKVQTYRRIAEA